MDGVLEHQEEYSEWWEDWNPQIIKDYLYIGDFSTGRILVGVGSKNHGKIFYLDNIGIYIPPQQIANSLYDFLEKIELTP